MLPENLKTVHDRLNKISLNERSSFESAVFQELEILRTSHIDPPSPTAYLWPGKQEITPLRLQPPGGIPSGPPDGNPPQPSSPNDATEQTGNATFVCPNCRQQIYAKISLTK